MANNYNSKEELTFWKKWYAENTKPEDMIYDMINSRHLAAKKQFTNTYNEHYHNMTSNVGNLAPAFEDWIKVGLYIRPTEYGVKVKDNVELRFFYKIREQFQLCFPYFDENKLVTIVCFVDEIEASQGSALLMDFLMARDANR